MSLSLTRIDAWSAAKVAFMLSIAGGIIQIVAVTLLWLLLNVVGVFDQVTQIVSSTGLDAGGFDLAKARSIDDPTPRDTAYLSAGTADLLYLSVRLALCELTCPADDPCPLVLDDTLVNFDDARAERARALFREIAQHRQVILFTCHERDCPAQG